MTHGSVCSESYVSIPKLLPFVCLLFFFKQSFAHYYHHSLDPQCVPISHVREIDGRCTSKLDANWTRSFTATFTYFPFLSTTKSSLSSPGSPPPYAWKLPSAREVSNIVCDQTVPRLSARKVSAFTTFFGQFVDHDLFQTPETVNQASIPVPLNDPKFPHLSFLPFFRSVSTNPPERHDVYRPINNAASAVDLSQVYGSTAQRSAVLRSFQDGKLVHSSGDLLPLYSDANAKLAPNAPGSRTNLHFTSGDPRSNEHPVLATLHTVFSREHNRLADEIKQQFPSWSDDELFQAARMINIAQYQYIVWNEFFPAMCSFKLRKRARYSKYTNPTPSLLLSTAVLRLGHSMVRETLLSQTSPHAQVLEKPLQDVFFKDSTLFKSLGGPDAFLRPLFSTVSEEIDVFIVNAMRNGLFSSVSGQHVLDLAAHNIQRGRDHNLPTYNEARQWFRIRKAHSFMDLTGNYETAQRLQKAYASVDHVEVWTGILAERKQNRCGSFGILACVIWAADFERLRDGDFYYYENKRSWNKLLLRNVQSAKLVFRNKFGGMRDLIERHSGLTHSEIPSSVWFVRHWIHAHSFHFAPPYLLLHNMHTLVSSPRSPISPRSASAT